jgi:hypothetical protein
LQQLAAQIQRAVQTQCASKLVVFGAAFGTGPVGQGHFYEHIWKPTSKNPKIHETVPYSQCHFTFVLEETLQALFNHTAGTDRIGLQSDPSILALTNGKQLVGVRRSLLPYQSLRRNVKLFKMNGH